MRQGADHVSAPRPPGLKEPAVGTCHQRHCGKGDANDQLTNAAACRPFGWFHQSGQVKKHPLNCGERPRPYSVRLICHCERTGTDRERTTPNIARRKQRTCPLRAHSNTWRPSGPRSLNRWSGSIERSSLHVTKKTITQSANASDPPPLLEVRHARIGCSPFSNSNLWQTLARTYCARDRHALRNSSPYSRPETHPDRE